MANGIPNRGDDYHLRQRQASGIVSNWLVQKIEDNGLSLSQACSDLQINPKLLQTQLSVLPFETYNHLFQWTADQLNNPHLGIDIGQSMEMRDLGALGYLLSNVPDLFAFCQVTAKYLSTFQRNAMFTFESLGEAYLLRYGVTLQGRANMSQDAEFTLSIMTNFFRRQLGEDWVPDAVYFSHPSPCECDIKTRVFGDNIHYDYAYNGFVVSEPVLRTPISNADAKLLEVILAQADQALEDVISEEGVVKYVRLLIAASLSKEGFNSDDAAAELHMTRRTLHRHLQRYGTSFQILRDEVLKEASQQALAETYASVTDIAMQLGFSEVSAFVRCFKRLTGKTPTQYRQLMMV
ncbi:AraC family transcriptional regulator ligand-binding domain-containing protein [Candidatus Pelagadaptatus aseana]|uniref:AraC family transcriptional regulator n=1 Tax=Candidatus Pelagadaptatus aseana TaxID=3120508 RepID=UPI003C6F25D7